MQQDRVYLEAAEWIDRLADGALDHLNQRRFHRWLEQDKRNRVMFETMVSTWESNALTENLAKLDLRREASVFNSRPVLMGWTLATLVLCACFILFKVTMVQWPSKTAQILVTQYSEQKQWTLNDGSELEAGPNTQIEVELTGSKRLITLAQGEAYFTVAKDAERPFEVTIGQARVVAVGTQFNIDRSEDGILITVFEGAVEVNANQDRAPLLLKASEQIQIKGTTTGDIIPIDPDNYLDWRSGWLELDNKPLRYLIERLNRRRKIPILISDKTLAELPIAGRFRLQNGDQVLAMLEEIYPLRVVRHHGVTEIKKR